MTSAECLLELSPSHTLHGVRGGVVLPPCSCRSIELVSAKPHLLCIIATCYGELPSYLAKAVICDDRLRAAGEHRRVQPQKTSKTVNWGRRRWVVVVVVVVLVLILVLDKHLHEGILVLDQLGELRWKGKFGVTSRRHLRV